MHARTRTFWLNAVLFIAVAALGYGLTTYMDRGTPPAHAETDTKPLPDFSFTALDGKSYAAKDFRGKIIIVNFWATWCAPCVVEFPELLKIAAANPRNVILIALSSDMDDDAIKKFLKNQARLTQNVYIARDREDVTLKVFGVTQLPETIITDHELNIREKLIGADWDPRVLQKIIHSL